MFNSNKYIIIKGDHDYHHNKKLAKIFADKIHPILTETLPKYMYKFLKQ